MIYLSAGHYPEEPGACNDTFCEHEEAVKWVDLIARHMGSLRCAVVPTGTTRKKVKYINENAPHAVVEVHFNSELRDPPRATGHLTMFQPSSGISRRLANTMHKVVSGYSERDRGIHEGFYQLNVNKGLVFLLRDARPPTIIIEPEFIHNKQSIQAMREDCCKDIAAALVVTDINLRGEVW